MTTEKLLQCNDVHGSDDEDGKVAVFAVAHQQGVLQDFERETDRDAMAVLYVTADGERACERWYPKVLDGEFWQVDRAFIADEENLDPIGENGRRWAPIAQKHPEVA